MRSLQLFWDSNVGKKVVMAVTGLALFGFVIAHMLGNLQVYLGAEALNAYARTLRHYPAVLWAARIGLLVAVALHIWAATTLMALPGLILLFWIARLYPQGLTAKQK